MKTDPWIEPTEEQIKAAAIEITVLTPMTFPEEYVRFLPAARSILVTALNKNAIQRAMDRLKGGKELKMKFKVGDVVRPKRPEVYLSELWRTGQIKMTVIGAGAGYYTVAWSEDGDIHELPMRADDLTEAHTV